MAIGRQRRRSWRGHALRLVALVLIGLVIGGVVALSNFDKDMYDRLVADRVEEALGRRLDIDGTLEVSLSLEPEFTATNVRLENPDWADGEDVLKISSLDARIALLPLLFGKLEMLHLAMDQVDADLEVAADGTANWNLETGEEGQAESGSFELDLPDELTVKRLNFTYTDHAAGDKLDGYFDDVSIKSSTDSLEVATTGEVAATPVTVDLSLPSLEAIVDPDLSVPIKGNVSALGVKLTIDGDVGLQTSGDPEASAKVQVESDDISTLSTIAGLSLPAVPFSFDGTIQVKDKKLSAKGTATAQDTTATVDVQIDTTTSPYTYAGTASISGDNTAWLARLGTFYIPNEPYTVDATFTLAGNLRAQGNGKLGDLKAEFDIADASWDGIPPQSVTLQLDGPDLSELGDWLDMGLPAVPFELSMKGDEKGSKFVISDAVVTSNDTKVTFDATLANLADPLTEPVGLSIATDDLSKVGKLYDLDLPATNLSVTTNLLVDGDDYRLGGLAFTFGRQDLTGALTIDDSHDRLAIAGNLKTDDLDVLAIADQMNAGDIAEDEPLIIPDPGIDIDTTLSATTVTVGDAKFQNVNLRIRTDDKHVGLYGLTAVFAGGNLASDFSIANGVENPPIDGTLKLSNASTTDISVMFDLPGDVRGPLNIDFEADSDITQTNKTIKDVTGHADLVLQNGYVGSDVLREADKFVNTIAPWRNTRDPSTINCLVLRYDLGGGLATSEVTLMDSSTMTLAGTGDIDLVTRTFNLRLVPKPKDVNLLSLATAVTITGPIDDPSLSVKPLDLATGAAGGVLGTLLTPIKALLPILGLDNDDNVCEAALDPDRGGTNAAAPQASSCARPKPWTDTGHPRFGRHTQTATRC